MTNMILPLVISFGKDVGRVMDIPFDDRTTLNDVNTMIRPKFPGQHIKMDIKDGKPISLCPQSLLLHGALLVKDIFLPNETVFISVTNYSPSYTVRVKGLESERIYSIHSSASIGLLKSLIVYDESETKSEDETSLYLDGSGEELNKNMTLQEAGLKESCTLTAIQKVLGGKSSTFGMIDVFNDKALVNKTFGTGTVWNILHPGFAIEGICENKNCVAFRQPVDSNHGFGVFNFNNVQQQCPMCHSEINGTQLFFSSCFYSIRGVAADETVQRIIPWRRVGDYYQHWNPEKAKTRNWINVQITTRQLELAKPVPNSPIIREAPIADNCTVCMGGMQPSQKITMLKCCHSYHTNCINEWKSRRNTNGNCPQCNGS